jgi:hypothetical protein
MITLDQMIRDLEEHQHKQGCETCGALNALKAFRDQLNNTIVEWENDGVPLVISVPVARMKARELRELVSGGSAE